MNQKKPLSREFLLNRGFCCNLGCLNCPYEITAVREALEELVEPEEVEDWLNEYNQTLQDKPINLIREGKYEEVWKIIYSLR
jgi:hypothetical protein